MMILGERLKQLRGKKYSQEELAELLNVHNNTISKWENGTQEPRAKRLKELAEILGTTSAYLIGETDNPEQQKEIPFKDKSILHTRQQSKRESSLNRGMLVFETPDGKRFEVPATPEGYAFLRDMAATIANREPVTMRTPAIA